ncbi:acyl carrier protein [Azospirillum sp. B506]|uniref:acyl carrier protein n=1 Tax=Azospirillum sp. B506 TaxID=137721 RepID=UPI000344D648|nr:acyl carrier protein [Azospirillum sp. B506]
MMAYLATICGEAAERMDPGQPLAVYDLDSVDAVEMALEMEKAFRIVLDPEIFLDTATSIAAIATAIATASTATHASINGNEPVAELSARRPPQV